MLGTQHPSRSAAETIIPRAASALEGSRVRNACKVSLWIRVGSHCPGRRVGYGDGVLDVRKCTVEDPIVVVERPAVYDLDHELDVVGRKEPEVAGVGRHRNSL